MAAGVLHTWPKRPPRRRSLSAPSQRRSWGSTRTMASSPQARSSLLTTHVSHNPCAAAIANVPCPAPPNVRRSLRTGFGSQAKINQDRGVIQYPFDQNAQQMLLAVFDGKPPPLLRFSHVACHPPPAPSLPRATDQATGSMASIALNLRRLRSSNSSR